MAKLKYNAVDIVREGKKLVLPENMELDEALVWLQRKMEEQQQPANITRTYRAFPLDGAAALARAMSTLYGWTARVAGVTHVSVPLPNGTAIEVPWGRFQIPGVEGYIQPDMTRTRDGLPAFVLNARTIERRRAKLSELYDAVQTELTTGSLYRGQAVRFRFPDPDDDFDPMVAPEFLDLSKVDTKALIFNSDVRELVDTTVLTPIRYTDTLRAQRIPLKRGILLEGPYGVGKTQLAYVVAAECVAHGWSYLYADVDQLSQALEFARLYEPAVVFCEDLDQVLGSQHRDQAVNDILNTMDGVNMKGREVMVILTTNHVERINKAAMRFGRLDAVISIPPPDRFAAGQLVALYAGDQLAPGTDLSTVGLDLAGQIPAMIREVVERAKLAAIYRGGGKAGKLTTTDLRIAARGMVRHQALLTPTAPDDRSDMEKAAAILARSIQPAPVGPAMHSGRHLDAPDAPAPTNGNGADVH